MSMHLPLSVRVKTAKMDRHITRDIRDLSFRSTAPGGYASAEFTLDRPLLTQPDEIAYYGNVYVYDGRSGTTVWEGRLEDQGRTSGPDGEVWQVTAVGPSAHAQDRRVPHIVIDRRFTPWIESNFNLIKTADISFGDEVVAAMKMAVPRGTVATIGFVSDVVDATYTDLMATGQKLARVSCFHISGITNTNWRVKLMTRTDTGSSPGAVVDHQTFTTQQTIIGNVGDTNFTNGHNVCNLRLDRDNSSVTVPDDDTWTKFTSIVVRAMLKNKAGTDLLTGYASGPTASEIVEDLLGRFLPRYDGANASIEATSFWVDQFAYPDGATPGEMLDALMEFEPGFYWAVWESNSAGLYRFVWRSWPTSVRYDATTLDGLDSPASADGLYNAISVTWRDQSGRLRKERRTQTVSELDAAGLTREELIDLGEEGGSSLNAIQVGDKFLAEHAIPPNAGTLTITRPIFDRDQGRMVMPWEIEPGHLIRIRGIQPRIDSLNATARDGVSVFRVVSVDFSTSDASATLELDAYSLTVARALADLQRRRR